MPHGDGGPASQGERRRGTRAGGTRCRRQKLDACLRTVIVHGKIAA
jgi:hypothetical protein